MIHPATEETIAQNRCIVMARQLADALGYVENPSAWMPFATIVWTDPNEPKREKKKLHKYLTGDAHRMVVAQPRGIMVSHEDYMVWFMIDSTGQWFVNIKGNSNGLEYTMQRLWRMEDSEWKDTRDPWMDDLPNVNAMTRQKWGESSGRTNTRLHPDSLETTADSSTSQTTQTAPTFGDLSSLEKHSRRKR